MAASGYTPILLYASGTATNVPLAANLTSSALGAELALNYADGRLYYKNSSGVVTLLASAAGAAGDVVGPASATDNALARFDTTTGKLIQNSVAILSDAGVLTGLTGLTSSGNVTLSSLTATRVPYASTGGLLVDSANMVFNGTRLTVADLADSGLTSGRVTYASTGGSLVDSANLTFDGTNLTAANGASIQGLTVGRGAGAVFTNTAVGASVLAANTTGTQNTAVGYQALLSNTTGGNNIAVGLSALRSATTGTFNTAIGVQALTNTTASNNTAVGYQAGFNNTSGSNLAAFGVQAGFSNTTGTTNAFFGSNSARSNTTGSNNTALGDQALYFNTTASSNTAVGWQAATNNTTGASNTALGASALQANTTASNNTAVGFQAGFSNTTGANNLFIGMQAAVNATTGTQNTFVGAFVAGVGGVASQMTTGSKNTILGGYNGNQSGLDIRTANNFIVLSDGDGNPRQIIDSSGNLLVGTTSGSTHILLKGVDSTPSLIARNNQSSGTLFGINSNFSGSAPNNTTSFFLQCNDTGAERCTIRSNGGLANFSGNNVNLSDRREKTNFAPAKSYLETICAIPVQTFNYIDQNMEDDPGLTLGVVAQDVQAVAPELVMESNWGTKEEPKQRLSIYQTDLQYALMKCIQEQQAIITTLTARVAALESN